MRKRALSLVSLVSYSHTEVRTGWMVDSRGTNACNGAPKCGTRIHCRAAPCRATADLVPQNVTSSSLFSDLCKIFPLFLTIATGTKIFLLKYLTFFLPLFHTSLCFPLSLSHFSIFLTFFLPLDPCFAVLMLNPMQSRPTALLPRVFILL
jgi:hypothetical protein